MSLFRILGVAGSLRRHSYNRGLLRAAQDLAPAGVAIEIADLSAIPLYNEDVHRAGEPDPVRAFKASIAAADALLIATPEYNRSVPGVLKNAVDWVSRPPEATPLRHKPIALMGAGGRFGTVRAQHDLRQVFVSTDSYVMVKPELMIEHAPEHFAADGTLRDEAIRRRLRGHVDALVAWARRVRNEPPP